MNSGSSWSIALLAGSSLIACPTILSNDFESKTILPMSFYMNAVMFRDNFAFKAKLISEDFNSPHVDATMEIPIVRKVLFRIGKPTALSFSL